MAKVNNAKTSEQFKTVVKGTLTRFRWEKGWKGKGDERLNISVKLDEPLTDEVRESILTATGLDVTSSWCPSWLEDDSDYVNVHTKFDLPCQTEGNKGTFYEITQDEVFEGAEVSLLLVCKEGAIYPQALRVHKNGEPYNPFEGFDY